MLVEDAMNVICDIKLVDKLIKDEQKECSLGCKSEEDCPSYKTNFAGGCEQCSHYVDKK